MQQLRKRPKLKKAVATGLFVFGVIALIVPFIPGWICIGLGLYLFSVDSPRIQAKILHYRTKHTSLDRILTHSYDHLHAKHSAPLPPEGILKT